MQPKTSPQTPSTVSDVLTDALLDAKVEELRRAIEAMYKRIDELVGMKSKASGT